MGRDLVRDPATGVSALKSWGDEKQLRARTPLMLSISYAGNFMRRGNRVSVLVAKEAAQAARTTIYVEHPCKTENQEDRRHYKQVPTRRRTARVGEHAS